MENGSQQIGAGRVAVVTGAASWRGRGTRTSGGRRAWREDARWVGCPLFLNNCSCWLQFWLQKIVRLSRFEGLQLAETYSENGADGRIRTGDPLFTNQDLRRPQRINKCWQVPFRIRPPKISCRQVPIRIASWWTVWWYFGGTAG